MIELQKTLASQAAVRPGRRNEKEDTGGEKHDSPYQNCGWNRGQATHKLAARCRGNANSANKRDIDPLAQRVFVLVGRDVREPASQS